jgi:hypothetical protein
MNGIILGTDITQEWILPWWWDNYSKYNSYPVTFCDFGMTEKAQSWCKERGDLIYVEDQFFPTENDFTSNSKAWEWQYGSRVWTARRAWFKKPQACLKSPYTSTIWVDLDCEIKANLGALFNLDFGIAKDTLAPELGFTIFNSGVISFKNRQIIEQWANKCSEMENVFAGDQEILSFVLQKHKIDEISLIWNWSRMGGSNPHAKIIHWHGDIGRQVIEAKMKGWKSLLFP